VRTLACGWPLTKIPPNAQQRITGTMSLPREVLSGKGRILFMDDEENIRTLVRTILEKLGYQVELVERGKGP
jgi:PleD family two-component response regulator